MPIDAGLLRTFDIGIILFYNNHSLESTFLFSLSKNLCTPCITHPRNGILYLGDAYEEKKILDVFHFNSNPLGNRGHWGIFYHEGAALLQNAEKALVCPTGGSVSHCLDDSLYPDGDWCRFGLAFRFAEEKACLNHLWHTACRQSLMECHFLRTALVSARLLLAASADCPHSENDTGISEGQPNGRKSANSVSHLVFLCGNSEFFRLVLKPLSNRKMPSCLRASFFAIAQPKAPYSPWKNLLLEIFPHLPAAWS